MPSMRWGPCCEGGGANNTNTTTTTTTDNADDDDDGDNNNNNNNNQIPLRAAVFECGRRGRVTFSLGWCASFFFTWVSSPAAPTDPAAPACLNR